MLTRMWGSVRRRAGQRAHAATAPGPCFVVEETKTSRRPRRATARSARPGANARAVYPGRTVLVPVASVRTRIARRSRPTALPRVRGTIARSSSRASREGRRHEWRAAPRPHSARPSTSVAVAPPVERGRAGRELAAARSRARQAAPRTRGSARVEAPHRLQLPHNHRPDLGPSEHARRGIGQGTSGRPLFIG